jgi:hypothetical protein
VLLDLAARVAIAISTIKKKPKSESLVGEKNIKIYKIVLFNTVVGGDVYNPVVSPCSWVGVLPDLAKKRQK